MRHRVGSTGIRKTLSAFFYLATVHVCTGLGGPVVESQSQNMKRFEEIQLPSRNLLDNR
jgi:hypothetical protein